MAKYLNKGKKQFTEAEKKAFHMGRAYETAKQGGRVKCPDEKTKQSFRNGVHAVRDKKPVQSNGNPLYVVDGDGCIVKVLNWGKRNG